jgi:CHAD domain-containing protein
MAYAIDADEALGAAIRRCAGEQLDRALSELSERSNEDPVSAVHDARKAIKKSRSLLRLARGAMPAKQRRRENDALRRAARHLSAKRDSDVMLATLGELSERYAGQVPARTFKAIGRELGPARQRQNGHPGGPGANAQAVDELGQVRMRVDNWSISDRDWTGLDQGLTRSYARGRKAFKRARTTRSSTHLHDWRKRAKDLWYHSRLLAPTCGPAIRGQAKDAHKLADLLGDEHDLNVLRQALTRRDLAVAADVDAVLTLIDHRRDELQRQAFRLGQRVYAEPRRAFRRRMRRSWKAGRATARVPFEQHPAELAAATRAPQAA